MLAGETQGVGQADGAVQPQDWLAFFLRLRQQHFIEGTPPEGAPAVAVAPHATAQESPWDYARDYLQGLAPRS